MTAKEEPFKKNILSEDEAMDKGYYGNLENQKTSKQVKNIPEPQKPVTKPRSFNEPVEKIAVELPKRLVKKMRAFVVEKESRFNIEAAEAFELYLKENKAL